MGYATFQAVYGIDGKQVDEALQKAGFDDEDMDLVPDLLEGEYNGNARRCNSDYLGIKTGSFTSEDGDNYLEFSRFQVQPVDIPVRMSEFNKKVDEFKKSLIEDGVDEVKVNKIRFAKPRNFIAVGND